MTLIFYRHIFEKYTNKKFHENPSNRSPAVSGGRKGGQTDMKKLTVAFFAVLRSRLKGSRQGLFGINFSPKRQLNHLRNIYERIISGTIFPLILL